MTLRSPGQDDSENEFHFDDEDEHHTYFTNFLGLYKEMLFVQRGEKLRRSAMLLRKNLLILHIYPTNR